MAGGSHGTRAVIAAMLANGGIAIAKFVGFVLTRSTSMLAESVHSVADTSNQALLLLGHRRAERPATPEHPFGYGRERYFWSFVVALILFSAGGMFATYEGIEKIRHPHELESATVAIAILVLGIVLEGFSFRTAIVESRKLKGSRGWWQFVRRSKTPELPVVLLEDLGAMVGLVLALAAVVTAEVTGDAVWDGYGTLSIGILLLIIAVILAVEMKSLLIGEAASEPDKQRVTAAIEAEPSVTRLLHMRTQHMGPDELLVGAKIELVRGLTMTDVVEVVNRVEVNVRRAVPAARLLYLEPDIFRTAVPDEVAAPAHDPMDAPEGLTRRAPEASSEEDDDPIGTMEDGALASAAAARPIAEAVRGTPTGPEAAETAAGATGADAPSTGGEAAAGAASGADESAASPAPGGESDAGETADAGGAGSGPSGGPGGGDAGEG